MNTLTDHGLLKSQAFLEGEWRDADSGDVEPVVNPSTGAVLATVPVMGAAETERAIAFASESMKAWAQVSAPVRSKLLRRWFDLVEQHAEDLAIILTAEQGKPLAEARAEVAYGAGYIEWFAEEAKRIYGDVIPAPSADRRLVVLKQPVGVCAAITPWNFPNAMITRKVAPALAAGCAIILKPASQTPLSAFALAELASRAGIPGGLFQVITGKASAIGGALTASPVVRKLTFTGSTPVGKLLMRECAATVKKVTMELGGNAPFLVFEDADLDAAVAGLMAAKFRNAGQTCVCVNRILVHDAIYDIFTEKLLAEVRKLNVGDGFHPDSQIGPLINMSAVEKVEELLAEAISQGAIVHHGGARHPLGGTFFTPTLIGNATHGMQIAREEIFGPVAPMFRFSSEDEAIRMANDTDVGLASYCYTRDLGRAWRVAEALEYGIAGVNTGMISNPMAPFGGIKESGLGREGSKYGIDDYLTIKYICFAGI